MRIRSMVLVLSLATWVWGTGCATMFSGGKQKIQIRAYPEDVAVTVNGEPSGTGDVELARDKQHIIEGKKAGYETRRIQVQQGLNGWFLANLLWGPFFWLGMIVDAATGSIQELSPTSITLNLSPLDPNAPQIASAPPPPPPVTPTFAGPSLDPNSNARGTGVGQNPPPQAPPNVAPPVASNRRRAAKTMANSGQLSWVLAVMDTTVSGGKSPFDKNTLSALTDQIRIFLAERGMRVVDRSSQEAALKGIVAEEKKKSYSTCVDSSCQIPLGKALAASHIMRSAIAKFGSQCATNGELIDLRAEVTVAAGSARSGCEEEDLLYAAESLAEQLVTASAAQGQ